LSELGKKVRIFLIGKLGYRPPFRDIGMGSFRLIPCLGDIKITITTAEFLYILGPVNTRTDDVLIELPVSGGQSARAAHITVSGLIDQKGREQVVDPVPVFVKKIAFGFLGFFQ
jgi:hypothetical protein